ncbi:hypothetical protein QUB70_07550 [Microcoleus sp. A003_D6]|uniref:hypothetical protein n=1 Tax=Microcoleus sp. A003_D6 TaxID=3055266 RepID=UPI002FCF209B
MRTPLQVSKEIKRIITFETNSMGEPMSVVVYKKKGVTAPTAPTAITMETATTKAKSILEQVVDSQIQAANEFKALNEKAGPDWLKELGKNITLAVVKGGSAFESK